MKVSFKPSADDLALIKKLDLGNPLVWIATLGGLGFCRPAPGTWGSLGALPLGIVLYLAAGLYGFIAAFFIFLALGYSAAKDFEQQTGAHDSKMVVIDELLGLWIALIPLFVMDDVTWISAATAFLLFRLFDIWKPWPIRHFDQNISGPVGVIADDIIAGQYAAIILIGLMYAGFIG